MLPPRPVRRLVLAPLIIVIAIAMVALFPLLALLARRCLPGSKVTGCRGSAPAARCGGALGRGAAR